MFFFQWHVLPELLLRSDAAEALEKTLSDNAKHGAFIDAFKYTFATYGAH